MSFIPKQIPEGAIRYNTDSNKMEVWIGDKWMIVSTSSPNLDGGVRGLFAAGATNVIDFVTIASAGNATDFGDVTRGVAKGAAQCASRTRGLIAGGHPGATNAIDFVTIASTGNSADFGDLSAGRGYLAGANNATRGVFGGAWSPARTNTIDYVKASPISKVEVEKLNKAYFASNPNVFKGLTKEHNNFHLDVLHFQNQNDNRDDTGLGGNIGTDQSGLHT